MELVDFLRARLDEDEAAARAVGYDRIEAIDYLWGTRHLLLQCDDGNDSKATAEFDADLAAHIARHDPARVLAEVEAKRDLLAAILAEPHATLRPGGSTAIYCDADSDLGEPCECGRDARAIQYVRLLARPYRTHRDFDPAWLED